jgi:uncharacterized protein (TIGR00369 family)
VAATRRQIIEQFIPASPFAAHLGLRLERLEDDRAVLVMPFRPELVTVGDVVHGGAIATLADTAVMAAAWADDTVPEALAGATVSLTVNFVSAARACDLTAEGKVVRRGRSLSFCAVTVTDPGGAVVATAMGTYRFG